MIYDVDSIVFLRIANRARLEEKELVVERAKAQQFNRHKFNSGTTIADVCSANRNFGLSI